MTIPLTKPDIQEADLQSMREAVSSGAVMHGPLTSRFETEFAAAIGAAGGIATGSATSALVLALRALDVGPGDEVVIPSYTCIAVLHAIVQSGGIPVLADNVCDPVRMDYNVSARQLAEVLTGKTRAIVVPHMFGTAADVRKIQALGIPVIEDITLSVGAEVEAGRQVGAFGELVVCSFHASKMLTCGEGGMLLANDAPLLSRARALNAWEDEQVEQRFEAPLDPYALRYNFRLSDVHAACGLSQLARLPDFIARRRLLAQRYAAALAPLAIVTVPDVTLPGRVYYRFIAHLKNGGVLGALRAFADAGIEAGRGVFPALHHVLALDPARFPGAEAAIRGAVSVPLYPALEEEEVGHILTAAVEILDRSAH